MTRSIPELIRRDPEVWTVLTAMVVVNVVLVSVVALGWLRPGIYIFGRFMLLGAVLAAGVFLFRGWKAPFLLLKPLTVWRFNPLWFVLVIAWPQALSALTLAIVGPLSGHGWREFDQVTLAVASDPHIWPNVVIGAFVGEIVWVGYAIGRLSRHTTPLYAALIVGMFWSSWWTPAVIYDVGVIHGIPVPALFMSQTAVAIMCGFVYAMTGSGWVVLALQISANCSFLIFPVSPESGRMITYLCYGIVYGLASAALLWRFGPKPLWPPRRADPPAAPA